MLEVVYIFSSAFQMHSAVSILREEAEIALYINSGSETWWNGLERECCSEALQAFHFNSCENGKADGSRSVSEHVYTLKSLEDDHT